MTDKKDDDKDKNLPPGFDGVDFDDLQNQLHDMLKGLDSKNSLILPMGPSGPSPKMIKQQEEKMEQEKEDMLALIRNFNVTPREVKGFLDRFVIKQSEAKKVLSVAICDHYNHIRNVLKLEGEETFEYIKQNVLLLGPTGVGKTYLIKKLAQLIGVPFVKADATKFSATGYMGQDVEDLVRDLVKLSNGNVELAECGIIYIDEIDKIANRSNAGSKDVSGRGVQVNLLKLMEDSNVNLTSQQDMMGQMEGMMDAANGGNKRKKTINTKNILFIVSGAFDKLSDLIKVREEDFQIGFHQSKNELKEDDFLAKASTVDFIKYGFEPEFIGRLPVRVACQSLLPADLEQIMKESEGSILKQYVGDFLGYNIDFKMKDSAIKAVAKLAYQQKTGARGLMTVMEQFLRDFKFELPGTTAKELVATSNMVAHPKSALEEILENLPKISLEQVVARLDLYSASFKNSSGFALKFNAAASKEIYRLVSITEEDVNAFCIAKFDFLQETFSKLGDCTKYTITKKR